MPVTGSTRPGTPTPMAATSSTLAPASASAVVDGGGDGLGGPVLVARGGGPGGSTEDGAVGGRDEHRDLGAADVDADEQRRCGAAGRGLGRRSWPRGQSSSPHRQAELAGQQQRARPEQDGVVGQAAVDDLGFAREQSRASVGAASSRIASSHGSPSTVTLSEDDDPSDVERADQAGDCGAEGTAGGADDAERELVAFGRRPARSPSMLCGIAARARSRARKKARRRIDGTLATVSRQPNRPQWHGAPSGSIDDVADLAGPEAVAVEELAIEHEAGADPVPDLDRDQVCRPVLALEQVRRERGGPAVVGDDRRQVVVVGAGACRAAGRSSTG